MQSFREMTLNEVKNPGLVQYKKDFNETIKYLNKMIEYGRKIKMDNGAINPLLEALKSIHTGDDAIKQSFIVEPEDPKEKPKTW